MIEDRLLLLRFRNCSGPALSRIYDKYRDTLLRMAAALLHDVHAAEDVVHDVFLRFAQSGDRIRPNGSLKAYLATCVVNGARNKARAQRVRSSADVHRNAASVMHTNKPEHWIMFREESRRIGQALAQIPDEQREVIVLRLMGDMKFKEIAKMQTVSIKTVQSRYRYGLEKLRSQFSGELNR